MRINEFAFDHIVEDGDTDEDTSHEELAAIGQLLIDKSEDTESQSKLSIDSFIGIAGKMGLPLSKESLMDISSSGELDDIIQDVDGENITFKGFNDVDVNSEMTVDKAKDTVRAMAKKNMNRSGLGSEPDEDYDEEPSGKE